MNRGFHEEGSMKRGAMKGGFHDGGAMKGTVCILLHCVARARTSD